MILTDAGPLVALVDKRDASYTACVEAVNRLPPHYPPLITTWPCFTEAMYLLGAVGGWRYQGNLWVLQQSQRLVLHDLTAAEVERMAELMEKYRDTPMDMADASLIAVAESLGLRQVFTLDSDFRIYRLADGNVLTVIP
ncbi:PIN domain-containing protein [Candidatus Poribacteria bacterium]|nr:PIN domain-containing protein [Candidatus Poribacteria bacterium]